MNTPYDFEGRTVLVTGAAARPSSKVSPGAVPRCWPWISIRQHLSA